MEISRTGNTVNLVNSIPINTYIQQIRQEIEMNKAQIENITQRQEELLATLESISQEE